MNASELAGMNLQSLPSAIKNILQRAKKEEWACRKRVGKGGGFEYQVSGLPFAVQDEIRNKKAKAFLSDLSNQTETNPILAAKKTVAKRAETQLTLAIDTQVSGLNQSQMDCAHARMALVAEVHQLRAVLNRPIKAAVQYFIDQLDAGFLSENLKHYVAIANARSGGKAKLSFSALYTWVRDFNKAKSPNERLAALAPIKPKEEAPWASIGWLPDWLSCWGKPNKPSLKSVYAEFKDSFAVKYGGDFPSIHQVRYVQAKLPEIVLQRGRHTGAAYKAIMPYIKRDWLMFEPNDIWVGDGHGFKAKVAHPIHGGPFQPEITMIIDAATRVIVGWSVSLSESTVAHADALRHAMESNTPPVVYYTDNGAGPTGKLLDADLTGILPRLGVDHATGIAGNAQGRGIIERLWKTVTIPLAKTYPTFIGADSDSTTRTLTLRKLDSALNAESKGKELSVEQKRYRKTLPTFEQFLSDLTAAVNHYNNEHEHDELKKATKGQFCTPAKYKEMRMNELGMLPESLSKVELEMMYRPEVERVTRRGLVSFMNNNYFSMVLAECHGETVRVSFDLHDASEVIVKHMDGRFICKAIFNGNVRAGFAESYINRKRKDRVVNKVKRLEQQIAVAEAELNPAIEHVQDFSGLLMASGHDVIEAKYEVLEAPKASKPKVYKMFKEDW